MQLTAPVRHLKVTRILRGCSQNLCSPSDPAAIRLRRSGSSTWEAIDLYQPSRKSIVVLRGGRAVPAHSPEASDACFHRQPIRNRGYLTRVITWWDITKGEEGNSTEGSEMLSVLKQSLEVHDETRESSFHGDFSLKVHLQKKQ